MEHAGSLESTKHESMNQLFIWKDQLRISSLFKTDLSSFPGDSSCCALAINLNDSKAVPRVNFAANDLDLTLVHKFFFSA